MKDKNEAFRYLKNSILRSYSQIFFSDNIAFAIIIICVTFFDVWAGFSGLLAVFISIVASKILGYDSYRNSIGIYGFNNLFVGLGLGIYYQPGFEFFLILFFASVFTFFITISLENVLGKYSLPFLSAPFLIGIWITMIAANNFQALGLSSRGIFSINEIYAIGGSGLLDIYQWWNNLEFPFFFRVYFLSLGAIFFQYNILGGILIAIGLLIYSRIGFSLSLLGLFTAYVFYEIIGANLSELNYNYIGFNYILTSIAIGGFFLVPSKSSYSWVILLVPVVALVTISTSRIFAIFGLPIYSLPFNIIVLLFLHSLKLRLKRSKTLREVYLQQNSPEKNLYSYLNSQQRFPEEYPVRAELPFWGEWTVAQAHNGNETHLGDWRHAWDFVITDKEGKIEGFNINSERTVDVFFKRIE